jgi:hypothetical protein
VTVHDHFDGSAHCVECEGPCKLAGDALELTRMVRFVLEFFAYGHRGWLPSFIEQSLGNLLGPDRLVELRNRCLACLRSITSQ